MTKLSMEVKSPSPVPRLACSCNTQAYARDMKSTFEGVLSAYEVQTVALGAAGDAL